VLWADQSKRNERSQLKRTCIATANADDHQKTASICWAYVVGLRRGKLEYLTSDWSNRWQNSNVVDISQLVGTLNWYKTNIPHHKDTKKTRE